ncbi:integration host factor subunit alpha [Dethiosulfatarculus sandiegensis]|uniref:Integration host factor subunit alpha n=1 Tax=Dethiosulfatarculus sandiegensis TaxID=1429043 RepID=A0A0D2HM64_9BACT|nr:integration host factor subunit alpha [Dethiosulfatarculus sandiegensis]KIX11708.1 integration host factor subunit alpha [Dethiosulfatarculus sandiegensis]
MALTKEKIINEVFEKTDVPKAEARRMVESSLEIMKDAMESGDDLLISGFGKFTVKSKQQRRGRNPQTKEDIVLPSRKVVVFKTSGVLRDRVNQDL